MGKKKLHWPNQSSVLDIKGVVQIFYSEILWKAYEQWKVLIT